MFGKVEIFLTYDLVELEKRKDALRQAGITYYIKSGLSSFFSNDRRQRGTYGERPGQTQLYRLLVKKKDEELALKCINK